MFAAIFFAWVVLGFGQTAHARTACTEMGCVNGISIDVPENYQWAKGKYHFRFSLDGSVISCEGRLPLPACGTNAIRCDKPGVVIMESGCALPAESQGFGRIMIDSFPAKVKVEASRDGKRIGVMEFVTVYSYSRPNGPGCEPVCRQDSLRMLELR